MRYFWAILKQTPPTSLSYKFLSMSSDPVNCLYYVIYVSDYRSFMLNHNNKNTNRNGHLTIIVHTNICKEYHISS